MQDRQLLWLGSLVAAGIMTASIPVSAQTNQSDTSGIQTYSAPSVSVDSFGGSGVPSTASYNPATNEITVGGTGNPVQLGSFFGNASGTGFSGNFGIDSGVNTGSNSNNASGTGIGNDSNFGTNVGNSGSGDSTGIGSSGDLGDGGIATGESEGSSVATGSPVDCATKACLEVNGSEPRKVTLNEIAEALEDGLEQSLDNLAAAEKKVQLANAEPRRIARRSAVSDRACINPVYEARETIERQLDQSKKFIEQVDRIEPQKNIW